MSWILILKSPFASIATHHHDHHQNIKVNCIYNLPLFDDDNTIPEIKIQASNKQLYIDKMCMRLLPLYFGIHDHLISKFVKLFLKLFLQPFLPLWQHQKAKELGNQHRYNNGVARYKYQSIKHNKPNSQTRNNQTRIQITENVNNHKTSKTEI